MKTTKKRRRWIHWAVLSYALSIILPLKAYPFCGFYVGKADAELFNEASQVVLVRNGNRTVISMMNDYKGELKEFALVVPVPVILKEGQVNVGDRKMIQHLDAYSAPRLVEYFDPDPCSVRMEPYMFQSSIARGSGSADTMKQRAKSLGVTVEAQYTVGEYDIVILSAKESDGLEKWLIQNKYKIPKGASKALKPYIKQKMKFFVAKVNLEAQNKTGLKYLRPLQFAFESEKFMLPIRLGMINSKGPQDLLVYVLTKKGRVETTNYRTVKLPTGNDIPVYVKNEFSEFYKDMFANQVKKESMRAVFTEYFWNMSWCDPCAADPLSRDELRSLGVFWVDDDTSSQSVIGIPRRRPQRGDPVQVMLTRLHVRYTQDTFPEDLFFQETNDKQNFQGRYVLRHPWKGSVDKCDGAKDYLKQVKVRQEKEAQTLASLTGWDINKIREKMNLKGEPVQPTDWWKKLWNK